ncbi:hypothetical protein L1887_49865 [Cichorium endivia]|nr:hypothetical protein L1887_49865 [Cichorium endivia]
MRRAFVGQFDLSRLSQAVRVRKAGAASRSKDSERVSGHWSGCGCKLRDVISKPSTASAAQGPVLQYIKGLRCWQPTCPTLCTHLSSHRTARQRSACPIDARLLGIHLSRNSSEIRSKLRKHRGEGLSNRAVHLCLRRSSIRSIIQPRSREVLMRRWTRSLGRPGRYISSSVDLHNFQAEPLRQHQAS